MPYPARDDLPAWAALRELYHRYLTGLILAVVSRHGAVRAADVMFETLRSQQEEAFLAGLRKLGLDDLPHAVACAQYHVLSNSLGGVRVEWIPESDTKSWVRYVPPRWIFDGTAICGIPTEVSRAMMRGWHANNGVLLKNPRLGFVCTKQTTDGQAGLEGYYTEESQPLAPDERLRFAPEEYPAGEAQALPAPEWSADHLAKVARNYSMAYVRSIIPAMCRAIGPADAGAIGRIAGSQIGMQYHASTMAELGGDGAESFADRFVRLLRAHGDEADALTSESGTIVRLRTWRIFRGLTVATTAFEAWNGLWEGLAAMEGYHLMTVERLDLGDPHFAWRLIRRANK